MEREGRGREREGRRRVRECGGREGVGEEREEGR